MAIFRYVARDTTGRRVTNKIEAEDRQKAIATLREQRLIIVYLRQEEGKPRLILGRKKVGIKEMVVFSRQLTTLVEAGVPIVQALDILSKQSESTYLKRIIIDIHNRIEAGENFSDALNRYKSVFSDLFINMARAGEASGALEEILDRLANYLEKEDALERKVKTALVYPIAVTSMAIIITTFLLLKVVPTFRSIFEGFGSSLPGPTLFLLSISDLLRRTFGFIILGLIGLIFLIRLYIGSPRGKLRFHGLLLSLPLIGNILKKAAISRFCRTLATLINSGIDIIEALEIVSSTTGNKQVELEVRKVRDSIIQGEGIASPLSGSTIFPPLVTQMIAVGEKTGSLDKMLRKIADFYDVEVSTAVDGLTSLLEPIIMVVLGIVIGGIVVCLYLPLFKIGELVR